MHPALAHLLAAAHGINLAQLHTGGPIGGALSFQMPAAPASQHVGSGGASDRQIAETAAQHLLSAASHAHDPALKASFSQALAALHKYIAQDDKEHHQALAGKLSPRLMAQAHGKAA